MTLATPVSGMGGHTVLLPHEDIVEVCDLQVIASRSLANVIERQGRGRDDDGVYVSPFLERGVVHRFLEAKLGHSIQDNRLP